VSAPPLGMGPPRDRLTPSFPHRSCAEFRRRHHVALVMSGWRAGCFISGVHSRPGQAEIIPVAGPPSRAAFSRRGFMCFMLQFQPLRALAVIAGWSRCRVELRVMSRSPARLTPWIFWLPSFCRPAGRRAPFFASRYMMSGRVWTRHRLDHFSRHWSERWSVTLPEVSNCVAAGNRITRPF